MTSSERGKIIKGAKEVFFKALLDGYAGGVRRNSFKVENHGGHTITVTFVDGDYVVEDRWHTNPDSSASGGSTLITYQGIPVWWMTYGGRYPEALISVLKSALRQTYERKEFHGGRGPAEYKIHGYLYRNKPHGDFTNFRGVETIGIDPTYKRRILFTTGFHSYFGMSLI